LTTTANVVLLNQEDKKAHERPSAYQSDKDRRFHLRRREALLLELAAIEEYLGLPRSVAPKDRT